MLLTVKGGSYTAKILLGKNKDRKPQRRKDFYTAKEARAYVQGLLDGEGWLAIEKI